MKTYDAISDRPESILMMLAAMFSEDYGEQIIRSLSVDWIYGEVNKAVYTAMRDRFLRGEPWTFPTLCATEPEWAYHISEVCAKYGQIVAMKNENSKYVDQVKRDYVERQGVQYKRDLENAESLSQEEIEKIHAHYREVVSAVGVGDEGTALLADVMDKYSDPEVLAELKTSHFPTGWSNFDWMIKLRRGNVVVLAGRPGMGKTDVSLFMALQWAKRSHRVAMFNLEMGQDELMERLSMNAGGMSRLAELRVGHNIWMEEVEGQLTAQSLASNVMRLRREEGVEIFVVDYLQLMGKTKGVPQVQAYEELTAELKSIARSNKVLLLLLSQLSRATEGRENKRPTLADLRSSGSIEQDADIVMFPFRPGYYAKDQQDNRMELLVEKNRRGPTGMIEFHYNPETKAFRPITYQEEG